MNNKKANQSIGALLIIITVFVACSTIVALVK